jgi:regulation of enolase protein 1 (concanavalin A-like superfamily)
MLASSILIVALTVAGQGEKKWEVVTSKEGNFTVEMPVKPNHTRSSTSRGPNGGKITVNEISCDTSDGGFIVVRIEDPVIIPKSLEDRYLEFTRDMYAEKFHGKVTSDKKVNLDLTAGRDFEIRAQDPKVGIVMIRAREYLKGKSIYLLLVASEPNKGLPEGAAKFLGSFAYGIHPEGTTVKADPRETEAVGKELSGWGMAIDPDGDVQFKPSDKSLLVEIPGTLHDLVADIGKFNAPRILRPVEGDFVSIVRIDGSFKPGGKSTKEKTYPLNAAGLVLWKDSENYVLLMRTAMLGRGNKINSMVMFEEREAGHRGAMHNQGGAGAGPVFLRLERKNKRITGAFSDDGVSWKPLKAMDTSWADGPIKVGLVATNTSSEPSTVKYENYSLKTK